MAELKQWGMALWALISLVIIILAIWCAYLEHKLKNLNEKFTKLERKVNRKLKKLKE